MKKLTNHTVTLLLISICMLAACSEMDSPVSSAKHENSIEPLNREFENEKFEDVFTLESGDSISLHYGNTNLILIKSYVISNCLISKKDLQIRTSNQTGNNSLPCSWKEQGSFAFEDLTIKNLSRQRKEIKVYLTGLTLGN